MARPTRNSMTPLSGGKGITPRTTIITERGLGTMQPRTARPTINNTEPPHTPRPRRKSTSGGTEQPRMARPS
ncbi:hypothetical protein N9L68_05870 [bacterium]|nr:hypothetical protein [bacterium]